MTVEYRVREIKRYVVTRFETSEHGGSVSSKGEYENFDVAYQVGYALCKAEHDSAGTPPDDMGFIYPRQTEAWDPSSGPAEITHPGLTGYNVQPTMQARSTER